MHSPDEFSLLHCLFFCRLFQVHLLVLNEKKWLCPESKLQCCGLGLPINFIWRNNSMSCLKSTTSVEMNGNEHCGFHIHNKWLMVHHRKSFDSIFSSVILCPDGNTIAQLEFFLIKSAYHESNNSTWRINKPHFGSELLLKLPAVVCEIPGDFWGERNQGQGRLVKGEGIGRPEFHRACPLKLPFSQDLVKMGDLQASTGCYTTSRENLCS